jgi:hypothetical protein
MGKIDEERPNQSWSALQLLPQGLDGATLTMMFKNDHAALLPPGVIGSARNSETGHENQFAAGLHQIENCRNQGNDTHTGHRQIGQSVRNT